MPESSNQNNQNNQARLSLLKTSQLKIKTKPPLLSRFRGYFPVVIDVETAGFNAQTDALIRASGFGLKLDETTGTFSYR